MLCCEWIGGRFLCYKSLFPKMLLQRSNETLLDLECLKCCSCQWLVSSQLQMLIWTQSEGGTVWSSCYPTFLCSLERLQSLVLLQPQLVHLTWQDDMCLATGLWRVFEVLHKEFPSTQSASLWFWGCNRDVNIVATLTLVGRACISQVESHDHLFSPFGKLCLKRTKARATDIT